MRHPSDGILRRLLDEPAGVGVADREHVADCDTCLRDLAVVRRDADLVSAALQSTTDREPDIDIDAAWARLTAAVPAGADDHETAPTPIASARTFRRSLRRPVAAGVAAAVILTGAGAAAANNWFEIFRTEKVAPIAISPEDLNALPDLKAYGDVELSGAPEVRPVADAAEAEAESGLDVPEVAELPRGVTGEPAYRVGRQVSVTFTFSAARAAEAAARAGEELPSPPPGLDGSQVRMVAGPGVAAVWRHRTGVPALIVGRAVAPTGFSSSGVPFETMRDYLLSLPGLPEHVAAPLRTFNADATTLPLPVPARVVTTSTDEVDGRPATVLRTRDNAVAAVVWVDDGKMTVVAGPLDVAEVLDVARGLR